MDGKVERERFLTSTPKDNTNPAVSMQDKHERKTLQTLQLSATGKKLNGGKGRLLHLKDNTEGKHKTAQIEEPFLIKPTHSPVEMVKIYADSSMSENTSIAHCFRCTQTDDSLLEELLQDRLKQVGGDIDDSGRGSGFIDQEAYDLMVKDEVSENYWKDLAEERRRALNESLTENERLCSRVELLKDENTKLAEENVRLKDIAEKAEAVQKLLESVLSNDDDSFLQGDSDNEAECGADSEPRVARVVAITESSQGTEGQNTDDEEDRET